MEGTYLVLGKTGTGTPLLETITFQMLHIHTLHTNISFAQSEVLTLLDDDTWYK